MTRFRAPTTTDSEDSSDEEQVHDKDSDTSLRSSSAESSEARQAAIDEAADDEDGDEDDDSEGSEMHEDELVMSPRARRRPVVDEDEDEVDERAVSIAMRPRGDQSLTSWAQHVGVDAQKMHVMQASLFRAPEEAAAMKVAHAASQPRTLLQPVPGRKHAREASAMVAGSQERSTFASAGERPAYRPPRKYARVEAAKSAVSGSEGSALDAGLALGRSFRVGWGPNGTLVHLGQLSGPYSLSKTDANSSIVLKRKIPIYSSVEENELSRSEKLLQHHLSNSDIAPDADGVPFCNPSPELEFSSFASLFPLSDRSYVATLFRLGQSLFDAIETRLADSVTVDVRNRVTLLRRKAAFSDWLKDVVAATVEKELRENLSASNGSKVFTLLTGNQVEKASTAATDGGNMKLATLMSQAGGDYEYQEDLQGQLSVWQEERVDIFIDEGIRKTYALLGGVLDVIDGTKAGGINADIDVTKGLDWKRMLGLHLWYAEPLDASLSHVFKVYDHAWKDAPERIVPPFASYAQSDSLWALPPNVTDALYSLIRLHVDPACSLSHILNPFSFGLSPLDYSIPWHLYIILSRCMRVRDLADRGDTGVRRSDEEDDGVENPPVEGHSPSADLMASSYAFQLEEYGMVQEAAFVLLHLESSFGRAKAIKDLLARNAPSLDEWMTRGIVGSLKIPMPWVQEAKAIHALSQGDMYEAYELYLSAGLYSSAHDIAVLELAPDAVIRQDLALLVELFEKLSTQSVDGWHVRGKAYLDYVHIMNRLPELHAELADPGMVPDAAQAQELEDLTRAVPRLIGILPDVLRDRSDVRHNAALAEMISGLMLRLDRVKPLALSQSQVRPTLVDEATRLRHIHSTAYERFMKTVEVA